MTDQAPGARKSHPSRKKPGTWYAMDSAPKDGTYILCFTKYGDYEICQWRAITQCWVSKRNFLVEAAHWSPLPSVPETLAQP
jgi:hypothetical protein